jgi:alanine racemase
MPFLIPARSWCEFDLSGWQHNLATAANCVDGQLIRVIPVIKADAYGHGGHFLPLELLESTHGVAVAMVGEAFSLRGRGYHGRIYLLSPATPAEYPAIAELNCIPLISSPEELRAMDALMQTVDGVLRINLELDTGMGRSGVLPGNDLEIIAKLNSTPRLLLNSLSSHFSSADENPDTTLEQEAQYDARIQIYAAAGLHPEFLHVANSAGTLYFPQAPPRVVRCGLMLYGVAPLPHSQRHLRPCLTWKTQILLTRDLPSGWPISYGGTYTCPQPMRVASIGVGYADGYPRVISGKSGHVIIQNTLCPILGRITMDQIMVDVSHLSPESASAGTEVILLGSSQDHAITAGMLAAWADTIPYEILTGIGPRVQRRPADP